MCYLRYLSTYSPNIKNLFGVTASNYDIKTLIKEEFGRRQQYIDVMEVIVVILKYTIRRSTDKILGPDTLTKNPIPELYLLLYGDELNILSYNPFYS